MEKRCRAKRPVSGQQDAGVELAIYLTGVPNFVFLRFFAGFIPELFRQGT